MDGDGESAARCGSVVGVDAGVGGVLGAYARALKMEEERRVLRGRTLLLVLVLLLVEVVWLVLMLGLLKG